MLSKIINWIAENQHLRTLEDLTKTNMERAEELLGELKETVKTDDICNRNTEGETSLLDNNFGKTVDEEHSDVLQEEVIVAVPNSTSNLISTAHNSDVKPQTETKKQMDYNNSVGNSATSPNKNLTPKPKSIDNVAEEIPDSKIDSSTFNKSKPFIFKDVSIFSRYTSPCNRNPKSIFTQTKTEEGNGERDHSLVQGSNECCAGNDLLSNNSSTTELSNNSMTTEQEGKSRLAPYTISSQKLEMFGTTYGTLFVVGCCKTVPDHLNEKMETKYILRKRAKANGIFEVFSYVISDAKSIPDSPAKYVILYPSTNNRSIVVAFKPDPLYDLFQIGRYKKHPIDFQVCDINPFDKARNGVSRFACRISVRRDGNNEARIYAGAFNSSQKIFIGENGTVRDYCGKMDGFTTNGVLILKPVDGVPGKWREVSVSGYIYPLRSPKIQMSKRTRILSESNVLIDGTLIDLCGITLLWRTPEGLHNTPNEDFLKRLQMKFHKSIPECSVKPNIRDSLMPASQAQRSVKKAYIYLSCGHVSGLTLPKPPDNSGRGWSCPTCRAIGPIKEFTVGEESGFYFDKEVPSCAFKPCGHVASEKTVKFWSSIDIPNHRNLENSRCPFCGGKLNFIKKYIKLTLSLI